MSETEVRCLPGISWWALWVLWSRVIESRRPRSILRDPVGEDLWDRLGVDGTGFDRPDHYSTARSASIDEELRKLCSREDLTVVSLGDGFQTRYWRIGSPAVTWVSVDLKEVVDLRRRLLPDDPRALLYAGDAFDVGWMDLVVTSRLIVVAEGLFMYFDRDKVVDLLSTLARSGRETTVIFDMLPEWFVHLQDRIPAVARRRSRGFPAVVHGMSLPELETLMAGLDPTAKCQEVPLRKGRGMWRIQPRIVAALAARGRGYHRQVIVRLDLGGHTVGQGMRPNGDYA